MKKTHTISFVVLLCTLCSCADEPVTEATVSQNLISNSSFEMNGNPSSEGWVYWSNTPTKVSFSDDTPPSGGNWSVVLAVGDRVGMTLRTTVPAPTGRNRFRLSMWAKAYWTEPKGSPGFFQLSLNGTIRNSMAIEDSVWKVYAFIDTFTAVAGDSLTVTLQAGDTYNYRQTFFDNCRLEVLR